MAQSSKNTGSRQPVKPANKSKGDKHMTITAEVLETLQNAFLADLEDALEIETDSNLIAAIQADIERRTA